jgi:hypothetical protein
MNEHKKNSQINLDSVSVKLGDIELKTATIRPFNANLEANTPKKIHQYKRLDTDLTTFRN